MKWASDNIERRDLATLIPYARNARTHSDAQVAQIAASIKEWGWTNPILIDPDGGIIAGHGRVLAAGLLGFKDVPVMVADGWTDAQTRAYILADNKLAENAGWDFEMLGLELSDLGDMGVDLSLIGFDDAELRDLSVGVEESEWPGVPEGEKEPFQQMAFMLHDDQAEQIKAAIEISKGMGAFIDSPNENSNGNALNRICEMFAGQHVER